MKLIIKFFLLLIIITFNSCSKDEVEVITNFGFSIETITDETAFLKQNEIIKFEIRPNQFIENTKYKIEYSVTEGSGLLIDREGTELNESVEHEIDSLRFDLFLYANELENIKLNITIKDNNGGIEKKELVFKIEKIDFNVNLVSDDNEIWEKKSTRIILNLEESIESGFDYTYKVIYDQELSVLNDINDSPIELNEYKSLEVGNTLFELSSLKPGNSTIEFFIKDELGNEISKEITIKIMPINFEVNLINVPTELFVTEIKEFEIKIIESITGTNLEYEMNLETTDDNGILLKSDEQILPNNWYPIEPGNTSFLFQGENFGNYPLKINIRVKDQEDRDEEVGSDILIKRTDFNLSLFTQTPNQLYRPHGSLFPSSLYPTRHLVKFTPTVIGPNQNLTYSISFSANKNGVARSCFNCPNLNINGSEIISASFVEGEEFEYYFLPLDVGDYTLSYTITASNGISKTNEFNFNVYDTPNIISFQTGYYESSNLQHDYFIKILYTLDGRGGDKPKTIEMKKKDGTSLGVYEYENLPDHPNLPDYKRFARIRLSPNDDPVNLENVEVGIRFLDNNGVPSDWKWTTFTASFNDNL